MSSSRGRPPPAPRRATTAGAVLRQRSRKPPPVEFLADELVQEDQEGFLPDEFVLDDTPVETGLVFAGISDAPPRPVHAGPADAAPPPTLHLPSRGRTHRWLAVAAVAFAAIAVVTTTREPRVAPAPAPALASASASALTPPASLPPDPPPPPPALALDTQRASQQALEHGKVAQAIELGERAVDLDPTDAESWLILGAAYLQRGKYKDARRCFSACVAQATQGPRRECAALLR